MRPPHSNPWAYWVTLYTDASYSPGRGGTFGCRTRSGFAPYRTEHSGEVPECSDNNQAEMYAIVAGVEHALETWEHVDGVGVRTDSRTAQSVLKYGAPPHRRDDFRALQERLVAALKAKSERQGSAVRIRIVWVPGHQGGHTVQGWMNERVDSLARRARG